MKRLGWVLLGAWAAMVQAQVLAKPDNPRIPEAWQKEYLFTNAASHPFIQTFGVATCVALSLWEPGTRTGLLAHLDVTTPTRPALEQLLHEFTARGFEAKKLQARLVGGQQSPASQELVATLREGLKAAGVTIVSEDVLLPPKPGGRSVQLNLATGQLENYTQIYPAPVPPDFLKVRQHELEFPGNLLTRHPSSLPVANLVTRQIRSAERVGH